MKKVCDMVKLENNYIVTDIKATPKTLEKLKANKCTYQINKDGCLTFRYYISMQYAFKTLKII